MRGDAGREVDRRHVVVAADPRRARLRDAHDRPGAAVERGQLDEGQVSHRQHLRLHRRAHADALGLAEAQLSVVADAFDHRHDVGLDMPEARVEHLPRHVQRVDRQRTIVVHQHTAGLDHLQQAATVLDHLGRPEDQLVASVECRQTNLGDLAVIRRDDGDDTAGLVDTDACVRRRRQVEHGQHDVRHAVSRRRGQDIRHTGGGQRDDENGVCQRSCHAGSPCAWFQRTYTITHPNRRMVVSEQGITSLNVPTSKPQTKKSASFFIINHEDSFGHIFMKNRVKHQKLGAQARRAFDYSLVSALHPYSVASGVISGFGAWRIKPGNTILYC